MAYEGAIGRFSPIDLRVVRFLDSCEFRWRQSRSGYVVATPRNAASFEQRAAHRPQ
jgi:hypothetical protein